jgi:hypothetical protein
MSFASKIGKLIANGILVVAISTLIFVVLANLGLIPRSEEFTFGG